MSGATCKTVKLIIELQENGIIRLASNGRFLGRLKEDEEVNFEKLAEKAYDGSKLDKADQHIEKLEKALHLACADAADDCCPHELYDYDTEKCGDCPHDGEIHQDTERDIACWEKYYLQEAYKEIMSNR